jgi:hypothetical protein
MMTVARALEALSRGAIFVVQYKGGLLYSESPEEQGIPEGPKLLRIFQDYDEAKRYRDAVEEYQGTELVVAAMTIDELWWPMKRTPGLKVELCQMPEHEWARSIHTLWQPGQELH